MKTSSITATGVSLLTLTLLTLSVASAQNNPSPSGGLGKAGPACKQQHNELASNLTVSQRLQLKAATKKVQADPRMASARQALQDAQTPEDRRDAQKKLTALRHDLLLKADPALAAPSFKPILDQIDASPVPQPKQ